MLPWLLSQGFHFIKLIQMGRLPETCHSGFPLKIIEYNGTMTKSGLKGHHNLAQGKATRVSIALGLSRATEIDREPAWIKKTQLLRSKWQRFS